MRQFKSLLILSTALIMASCGQKANEQQTVIVEEAPKVTVTTVHAENVPQLSTHCKQHHTSNSISYQRYSG